MSTENTCPRCHGIRMYRKCVHGCDGKKPEDVLRELRQRRAQKRRSLSARATLAAILLSGCASVVDTEPDDAADAAVTDSATVVDARPHVACVNSSTCPTTLACLQGFCSTPCETYDAGCE